MKYLTENLRYRRTERCKRMTARQFEKRVASVLEQKYGKYNVTDYKVWKEGNQIYLSVRFGSDAFRGEPWGVSAVFDKDGNCISKSYGSRRDYMFTRILVQRIEEACKTYTGAFV